MKQIECIPKLVNICCHDRIDGHTFIKRLKDLFEGCSIIIARDGLKDIGVRLNDSQLSFLISLLKELEESIWG